MTGWGLMFPGQGSQSVGMGRDLYDGWAASRRCFEEADDALGFGLTALIFEGPEQQLEATEWQQPAILTVSIAALRALCSEVPELRPELGLGLSLGEYSAYVASGVFDFADAVRLTRIRGRAMQAAVPENVGGMMAVLGLADDEVKRLCLEAGGQGIVEPANFNAPGQVVVAGLNEGLDRLTELVLAEKAKAKRLAVSAPFHSSLLAPAGAVLATALATLDLRPGSFPVIANVDGAWCQQPEDVVPRLITQVSNPVHFELGVRTALSSGILGLLELGPGRSLSSLVKKIDRQSRVVSVPNADGVSKALELLQVAKL